MPSYKKLLPGTPAPWFTQRTPSNPTFVFDTVAGRYLVLCFLGSGADPHAQAAVAEALSLPHIFNDTMASFFGVSNDPADERQGRLVNRPPGYRFFWDFDFKVSRLYGAAPVDEGVEREIQLHRRWVVLDPTLRIIADIPFETDRSDLAAVRALLSALPPPERHAGQVLQAPILMLPNVFSGDLCDRLIAVYEAQGGRDSGFMREVDGRTVPLMNDAIKRRRDVLIEDQALISETQSRISKCVVPEIEKAYQFHVTRMERYLVAYYGADNGGHFRPHRDNTTSGTAHRRFAVSINLNDDFEGGELGFPEYGPQTFKIPRGAAVVFSCSLLHGVSKVTKGKRYAFLPFLYDDAAADIRARNLHLLDSAAPRQAANV